MIRRKEPAVEDEEASALDAPFIVDVDSIGKDISRLLQFSTFSPAQRYWLDTGSPDLNAVLGSRKKGLAYGKVYELAGEESAGKTAITTVLAGLAQKEGAAVGYIDLENSRDSEWAARLGLDLSQTIQLWPKMTKTRPKSLKKQKMSFGKKKDADEDEDEGPKVKNTLPQLESAEMLFAEAETAMGLLAQAGAKKQFWFVDSIANLQTEMVVLGGRLGQNFRTVMDRSQFLAMTLPTWAGLAANYNIMIFLINQIRDKQGMVFGKKTYTPGGRAKRHAVAIAAEVSRVKGAILRHNGIQVGIMGKIVNEKNKMGAQSLQYQSCGFRVRWDKNPARVTFPSLEEMLG